MIRALRFASAVSLLLIGATAAPAQGKLPLLRRINPVSAIQDRLDFKKWIQKDRNRKLREHYAAKSKGVTRDRIVSIVTGGLAVISLLHDPSSIVDPVSALQGTLDLSFAGISLFHFATAHRLNARARGSTIAKAIKARAPTVKTSATRASFMVTPAMEARAADAPSTPSDPIPESVLRRFGD